MEHISTYHTRCGYFGEGEFISYILDDGEWISDEMMDVFTQGLIDEAFWAVQHIQELVEEEFGHDHRRP